MDTRFWGPDGWKLVHSIAYGYPTHPTKKHRKNYSIFLNSLSHILPCVYCRRSFHQYLGELPIQEKFESDKFPLDNRDNLFLWIYRIHNKVNHKLRSQKIIIDPDPLYADIYNEYQKSSCSFNRCDNLGWNFINSIGYNYPIHSKECTLKQYIGIIIFFEYLPRVIPYTKISKLLKKYYLKHPIHNNIKNRKVLMKWIYNMRKFICNKFNKECPCFTKICNKLQNHKSGCNGVDDKTPTCRGIGY